MIAPPRPCATICLAAVWPVRKNPLRFTRTTRPTHTELQHLLHAIATRVTRALERQGFEMILTHLAARKAGGIDHPRAPPLHAPLTQPPASPSPTLS